jgi:hypothetical protein
MHILATLFTVMSILCGLISLSLAAISRVRFGYFTRATKAAIAVSLICFLVLIVTLA